MTTTLVLLLEPCTNVDKVGDVKDRVCVLLDDMSDSCGTLCKVRRSTIMDNDQGVDNDDGVDMVMVWIMFMVGIMMMVWIW